MITDTGWVNSHNSWLHIFHKSSRSILVSPSIDNAHADPVIRYAVSSAEFLPVKDNSADLIVAAQAAHWFDLPLFYEQARRVAKAEGVIALVSYGIPEVSGPAGDRFHDFYWQQIHHLWPDRRRLVENGYSDIEFPFAEIELPRFTIEYSWTLKQLIDYIATWSAMRNAELRGEVEAVAAGLDEIRSAWGESSQKFQVRWPINGRVGRIANC